MGAGSRINSTTVGQGLKLVHSLQLGGPVLSVPALVNGYAYVGIANSQRANARGGSFYKVELASGSIAAQFTWDIPLSERDTHGFTGMGCTPAVVGGKVYFSAFNGKLYCLDAGTLALAWVTDLRYADPLHRQPVNNDLGVPGAPVAAGWSSPVVANGKVYVGMGEGENPDLFGFVYCLDAQSGDVVWIFCTCQFVAGQDNAPNVLPQQVLRNPTPGFSAYDGEPVARGCSVWSSIAYDQELQRLFCATGNAQPDGHLPTPGYSNGVLALDAVTGAFKGFFQVPSESSYRPSDIDIDIGGSPTLVTIGGRKVVAIGCKNGGFFLLDAESLQLLRWRQLLPYANNGDQIATVDPHTNDPSPNPRVSNETSNATDAENYSGTYSTAAFDPATQRFFIGIGGPNYHSIAPGIDYTTTPFMRALDAGSLADSWPMDASDPRRYVHAQPPMYTNPAECGLSSPAAVNDVGFCTTSKTAIYAFAVQDGTPWIVLGLAGTALAIFLAGSLMAIGSAAFTAGNWAFVVDVLPPDRGAHFLGLANIGTAGAAAAAGLFGPLVDWANARAAGASYTVLFAGTALAFLGSLGALYAVRVLPTARAHRREPDLVDLG